MSQQKRRLSKAAAQSSEDAVRSVPPFNVSAGNNLVTDDAYILLFEFRREALTELKSFEEYFEKL